MRLIHLSDWHLDSRRQLAGSLREGPDGVNLALSHTAACLRAVADKALAAGHVDLWLLTGDLTDTATPTQIEERIMIELVTELAKSALVIIIAGNHDVPGSGSGASSLECLKRRLGVIVVEAPEVVWLKTGGFSGAVMRSQEPTDVAVACMPYPRRSEFVALAPEGSREERYAKASAILDGMIQSMRVTIGPDALAVMAYHGSINGATVGVQPRTIEHDLSVPVGAFAGFDYVGCGHIHKMQKMSPAVFFAGSVDRTNHDEAADPKGGLDVVVAKGVPPVVKMIASPARRYMTLGPDDDFDGKAGDGIVYRVKGAVTPQRAGEIRHAVALLAASGVWISTALTIESEARTRDEHATSDERTSALLDRWLDAHGEVVADIVTVHDTTETSVREAVHALNTAITGE